MYIMKCIVIVGFHNHTFKITRLGFRYCSYIFKLEERPTKNEKIASC